MKAKVLNSQGIVNVIQGKEYDVILDRYKNASLCGEDGILYLICPGNYKIIPKLATIGEPEMKGIVGLIGCKPLKISIEF